MCSCLIFSLTNIQKIFKMKKTGIRPKHYTHIYDLNRCVLSDFIIYDIHLIHYNLKQRQMRFKPCYTTKKTPPNFTVRWCQRFLEKIKYYFRRNMVFGNMKCCYLILNKKHSPIFTDTCVLKKLQN